MELLLRFNQEGMTIVMVTHSPACAGYAQRIMRVTDGRLAEDDPKIRSIEKWERNDRKREPLLSQDQQRMAAGLLAG
jgi:ABC-type multidrug transport system ATPase subunit